MVDWNRVPYDPAIDGWFASGSSIAVILKKAIMKEVDAHLPITVLANLVVEYDMTLVRPLELELDAGSKDWVKSFLISNGFESGDVDWGVQEWRQIFQRCLSLREGHCATVFLNGIGQWPLRRKSTVLSTIGTVELKVEDYIRLGTERWLNDNLIAGYFSLIAARSFRLTTGYQIQAIDSNFFVVEIGRRHKYVRKLRCQNIFVLHMLMFPIHVDNSHWILAVVNFRLEQIAMYDSLHALHQGKLDFLLEFLHEEAARQKVAVDFSRWTTVHLKSPSQTGTINCGVFVCITGDYLAQGLDLDYTDDHVPLFRLKMVRDLRRGFLD